jgi:predicted short-subunit dehydrogenase-like oxidoreductase (DUF2520 family)
VNAPPLPTGSSPGSGSGGTSGSTSGIAAGAPLAGLEFALIGPGRVGASLALWAVAAGARCASVAGRAGAHAASELATRLGAAVADSVELAAREAKLVLVAVPDAAIGEVARRLAARRQATAVALHVSGAYGAAILEPLARAGWRTGSFHPLRAFPRVEPDLAAAAGTFFALDGDAEARSLGRRLAEAFGGTSAVVADAARPLYHWAASLAAGGVVTLLATAVEVGRRLGLPDAALAGYGRLATGALDAATAPGAGDSPDPAAAITGPVARGDRETVERHLTALTAQAPDLLPLEIELARATLARRAERQPPDAAQRQLAERLARPDLLDRAKVRVLASDRPHPA